MKKYIEVDKRLDDEFSDGLTQMYDRKTDTWEIDVTDEVKAFIHSEIDKAVAEKDIEIKSIVSFLTSAYFSVYYFYDENPPASQKTHDELRQKILGYVEKYLSPKK